MIVMPGGQPEKKRLLKRAAAHCSKIDELFSKKKECRIGGQDSDSSHNGKTCDITDTKIEEGRVLHETRMSQGRAIYKASSVSRFLEGVWSGWGYVDFV